VQDWLGHKLALALTLLLWIAMTAFAAFATSPALFWLSANLAGLAMGSSQSAGRAMTGLFAPRARLAEFYGLWALSVQVAAIVGPLTYGAITWATGGDQRTAILSTAVMFIIGLVLLVPLNMERGRQAALAQDGKV